MYAIGTLPEDIAVSPLRAELIGADYLLTILPQLPRDAGEWENRLSRFQETRDLVLRPILVDSRSYVAHLRKLRDWEHRPIRKWILDLLASFPYERLWMVEVSTPELFAANMRKLGEVLIHAETPTGSQRDMTSLLFARLPAHFVLHREGGPTRPKYDFIRSGAMGHTQLFGRESFKK